MQAENTKLVLDQHQFACYQFGMNPIQKYREAKSWSQAELARRANTSQPQIMRLEKGERKLTKEWAVRLAKSLEIAPQDLLFPGGTPIADLPLTNDLESAVDRDIGLPASDLVREIDVRSGAGGGGIRSDMNQVADQYGNTFAAEDIRDNWGLPERIVREMLHSSPQHIRAFEVVGDSMEPRLYEGDRVFVDLRYTVPSPEGIFVLWDGIGVVVKRLQIIHGTDPLKLRILSVNPQYEPYEATVEEVNIIGRYAGRFTTR